MTKRIIFITFSFIVISNITALSQNFKFGIVAGLDIAKSRYSKIPNAFSGSQSYNPMIAYNFNGYIGYKKSDSWGFSIEPGFIQKGGKQKISNETYVRLNLNYLQLPILLDYYIFKKLYISLGPELSYLHSAKLKSKEISNNITDSIYKRFELSGIIGLNYKITDYFDIGIRYNHGLTYTSKISWFDDSGKDLGESNEYNQYVQLNVEYKIF